MDEFALIEKYFRRPAGRAEVVLGSGDDAAVLDPGKRRLSITTDTLLGQRHFSEDADPADVGWKALAVNLSDLAAMGAEPVAYTLALSLPQPDERWLEGFAAGLHELAQAHDLDLIGGDTCQGPLSITITALGLHDDSPPLTRSGAGVGDLICVTGELGDAGLAWRHPARADDLARLRLARPRIRVKEGLALRNIASSAIDLSDGLAADLGHVLAASGVGATIDAAAIPVSDSLSQAVNRDELLELVLAGGDDYELCFTVPTARMADCNKAVPNACHVIGRIEAETGLRVLDAGRMVKVPSGFRHFDD